MLVFSSCACGEMHPAPKLSRWYGAGITAVRARSLMDKVTGFEPVDGGSIPSGRKEKITGR